MTTAAMSIRVCIADDHPLTLSGIQSTLAEADDIEVIGVTQRGENLLDLVATLEPDLVLLDLDISGIGSIECVKRIKQRQAGVKVVMLAASEDPVHIAEALDAGATAYVGKRINPRDLASTLRQIIDGVVYLTAPPPGYAPEPRPKDVGLTERELTMLEAISRGLSTKAISRELWVTEKTVKFHLTNIYRKLGVTNRASAMRYAFDHGLIDTSAAPSSLSATG
jgi:two-component system nitrate/nitrite response regulator NarL